ncbi:YARHG domain-containing protein, partial [Clostridium perfringens]
SKTGFIVINNGKDDDTSGENSTTNKTTKEVIIQDNNSNSSSNNFSSAYEVDGYIFSDSDVRYLTASDLSGLSSWELKLARNEIYARHGRLFKDSSLQNYFNSCTWYNGYISPDDFNDDSLNSVEKYNVK